MAAKKGVKPIIPKGIQPITASNINDVKARIEAIEATIKLILEKINE